MKGSLLVVQKVKFRDSCTLQECNIKYYVLLM